MSRKRDKPYNSRHIPYSYPKRRRPIPPPPPVVEPPKQKPTPPPALVVIGLPLGCSVLDLKSRFEIYGPISRIRIDPQGVGFISYRSKSAADSAISASVDPSFGISIDSHPVFLSFSLSSLVSCFSGFLSGFLNLEQL
uniref:RRM domain-containing protein n=1 Tax=Chenopodium quinoa TaxID=63459 RepID=A0A803MAZ7_CHEQI